MFCVHSFPLCVPPTPLIRLCVYTMSIWRKACIIERKEFFFFVVAEILSFFAFLRSCKYLENSVGNCLFFCPVFDPFSRPFLLLIPSVVQRGERMK